MRAGYESVDIQAESRASYIRAIRAFRLEDDPFPFVAFFCQNLLDRLERTRALLEVSCDSGEAGDGTVAGDGVGASGERKVLDYLGSDAGTPDASASDAGASDEPPFD